MGGIRGTVMDQDFEVPLPGVKVVVSETGQETETSDAGSYYLENIEPGVYTLLFSKSGYTRFTKPEVVVTPGALADIEASLAGEYEEMDELVVRDIQLGGSSEIGLLNLRMDSVAMMDSVGAELFSQAGASDAAQALRLIPGTTIQDGKYPVVRGLPDRYVVSLMNSVRLPTSDDEKRAVQLDQFPAAAIESIQVSKTFTPDQQGDASGGAVNIILKGIPEERVLEFKAGYEVNSQVMDAGDDFLSYKGGGVDYWGKDDGGRDLPVSADNAIYEPRSGGVSDADRQAQADQFDPVVGATREDAPEPDYNWGITAGDRFTLDNGLTIGALGNFNYKHDTKYVEGEINTYYVDNSTGVRQMLPWIKKDVQGTELYDGAKGSEEVQWSGLGIIGAEYEEQSIQLLYFRTQTTEDTAQVLEDTRGPDVYGEQIEFYSREQTLRYTERETSTLQLSGEHVIAIPEVRAGDFFTLLDPKIDWMLAHSESKTDEPDTRFFSENWSIEDELYLDVDTSGDGIAQRLWKNIEEDSGQFFINGAIPFEQWTGTEGELKLGLFSDSVSRDYTQDSFLYTRHPGFAVLPFETYWSDVYPFQDNSRGGPYIIGSGDDIYYDGETDIDAWYWMGDVPLSSFLNIVGGFRFENTDISIVNRPAGGTDERVVLVTNPDDPAFGQFKRIEFGTDDWKEYADASLDQDDVLPSIGVVLRPIKNVTLRASYSETVARPTFRELSPIQQVAYAGGPVFIGNNNLEMSSLQNEDIRAEWTPYPGGLISGSWFHKDIDDPIEAYRGNNAGLSYTTVDNYPEGEIDGYEFEIRQHLGALWQPLLGLNAGFNYTVIDSEVTVPQREVDNGSPETRDMLNTPEKLWNANLTYEIPTLGTQLGLFYIFTGDKLIEGATYLGNEFPNVYEKEVGRLNFSLSQKLGDHWKISFKVKNITDPDVEEVYRANGVFGEEVYKTKKDGRDYSIGVSCSW